MINGEHGASTYAGFVAPFLYSTFWDPFAIHCSSKIVKISLIGICSPPEGIVELPRVPHVPHEYLRVLPAACEDLGAVGREPDVGDAAALSGQQAEAAALRLEVEAQRLSAQGEGTTELEPGM